MLAWTGSARRRPPTPYAAVATAADGAATRPDNGVRTGTDTSKAPCQFHEAVDSPPPPRRRRLRLSRWPRRPASDTVIMGLLFAAWCILLHAHKVAVLDDAAYAVGVPDGGVRSASAAAARLLFWAGLPGSAWLAHRGNADAGSSLEPPPPRDADMMAAIEPLMRSRQPFGALPRNASVGLAYAALAKVYTAPFRAFGGIPRALFMDVLERGEGVGYCATCFLVQVKTNTIYVYDPRGVRNRMSPFHALRMREVLLWTKLALRRGRIGDTEFVVSVTDTVASTRCAHPYRLATPEAAPRPIFTIVHCNVSDNIPFPMFTGDLLRRAFPAEFWTDRGGRVSRWDAKMAAHATSAADVPWVAKQPRAVFRGVVRVSAAAANASAFHATCGTLGRPALAARSAGRPHLFDVQIEGVCGRTTHTARRLTAHQQSAYRYGVYVEGNGFWADRLVLQLFGASATFYQLTPCGLFFEPLLRPYVHVIPVDYHFRDLERQVVWARHHDAAARRVAVQGRAFASEYLSTAGIRSYAEAILLEYTKLLHDRNITIVPGAKKY